MYQLLFQTRQETRFIENVLTARAILDAPLQLEEGVQTGTELQEVMEAYIKSIFPYHEADSKRALREMQEVLEKWVRTVDNIVVEPLPDPIDEIRKARRTVRAKKEMDSYNKRISALVRRRLA